MSAPFATTDPAVKPSRRIPANVVASLLLCVIYLVTTVGSLLARETFPASLSLKRSPVKQRVENSSRLDVGPAALAKFPSLSPLGMPLEIREAAEEIAASSDVDGNERTTLETLLRFLYLGLLHD